MLKLGRYPPSKIQSSHLNSAGGGVAGREGEGGGGRGREGEGGGGVEAKGDECEQSVLLRLFKFFFLFH